MSNDGKLKILVTGGGGFIGSFLAQQLSRKHKIIILDHGNRYKILKKKIKKNVEFVIGDVTDEKILDRILKKNIDVIIHLAGVLGNNACMNDPVNAVISHVNGTHVLIKKSKHYHVKRFILYQLMCIGLLVEYYFKPTIINFDPPDIFSLNIKSAIDT